MPFACFSICHFLKLDGCKHRWKVLHKLVMISFQSCPPACVNLRPAVELRTNRTLKAVQTSMAGHFAFSPQEDDAIIKQRLLTRTTVTRGEPPIKKLTKKFLHLSSEVFQDGSSVAECQRLARLFLQELSAFQQPLQLTRSAISADEREQQHYRDLQGELQTQITQVTWSLLGLFGILRRECCTVWVSVAQFF